MSDLRADAVAKLRAAGIDSAESDVRWLLVAAGDDTEKFRRMLERRATREPLQHILGEAWFRHLTLQVGPGVFVPRPETEVLVDLALSELSTIRDRADGELVVVDLCTGSGAIALSVAIEGGPLRAYAVEADPGAAEWAARNLVAHEDELAAAGSTLELHVADVADVLNGVLDELAGNVDVVTCNPPYIPSDAIPRDPEVRDHDPAMALYGGLDGLDVVRTVVDVAAGLLKPRGSLFIEHGDMQGNDAGALGVPAVLNDHGAFVSVVDHKDLTDRPRVTSAFFGGER